MIYPQKAEMFAAWDEGVEKEIEHPKGVFRAR